MEFLINDSSKGSKLKVWIVRTQTLVPLIRDIVIANQTETFPYT